MKTGIKLVTVALVVLVILLIMSLEIIPNGYAGVVYTPSGGLSKEPLSQGWKLIGPINKCMQLPVSTETMYMTADPKEGSKDDDSYTVPTKDGKQVRVGCQFDYRYDFQKLPDIFNRFRGKSAEVIADTFMRGRIKSWNGEIAAQYTVQELYGEKRTEISEKSFKLMKDRFAEFGIIVDGFILTAVLPDEDTLKAIQKMVNARQEYETELLNKQKEEVLAQTKVVKAQADADAAVKDAEGKAKSAIENAKAEVEVARNQAEANKLTALAEITMAESKAKANKLTAEAEAIIAESKAKANKALAKSITPELVQYMVVEKWDGKRPLVEGTNSNTLLEIPIK